MALLYLACNEKLPFFTSEQLKDIICGHVRMFVMLSIIFWTIFISFGTKLYRHHAVIQMGYNCAPLVSDICFCFVMKEASCHPLSDNNSRKSLNH